MIDLRATAEMLEAARKLGACEEALEKIQPGQEVTNFYWLDWVDDHYEKLPVPVSVVPFCLYATDGDGDEYGDEMESDGMGSGFYGVTDVRCGSGIGCSYYARHVVRDGSGSS